MTVVVDALTVAAIGIGMFFFMAGTIGLLRFPDALTRLHALTKVDNLALGFIVAGLLLQTHEWLAALKLAGVWLFVQLSAGIVAQILAQAIVRQSRRQS